MHLVTYCVFILLLPPLRSRIWIGASSTPSLPLRKIMPLAWLPLSTVPGSLKSLLKPGIKWRGASSSPVLLLSGGSLSLKMWSWSRCTVSLIIESTSRGSLKMVILWSSSSAACHREWWPAGRIIVRKGARRVKTCAIHFVNTTCGSKVIEQSRALSSLGRLSQSLELQRAHNI